LIINGEFNVAEGDIWLFLKFKDLKYDIGNLQVQILELLKKKSMYGYEIIQELSDFKLNTAILYPALKKLEEKDLIKSFLSSQSRGPKKRKNYELTEKGFEFIENLYDLKLLPEHYIEFSRKEADYLKQIAVGKDCLVIDSSNFINMASLFNSKAFYNNKIPKNIEIMRYYNFKQVENIPPKDQIMLGFPFFIHYDIKEKDIEALVEYFKKVKEILKKDGLVWVLDLYWDRNAIIDTLTFLISGKVKRMGFTWEEMQEILKKASFTHFDVIIKDRGLIIFSCK